LKIDWIILIVALFVFLLLEIIKLYHYSNYHSKDKSIGTDYCNPQSTLWSNANDLFTANFTSNELLEIYNSMIL